MLIPTTTPIVGSVHARSIIELTAQLKLAVTVLVENPRKFTIETWAATEDLQTGHPP